ncbi:MAG TPA: MBL fold metallo-hydrolase [Gemmatimonadaceae bacterium]|nr:MBL fold metallo-hydrolase [Gemmatimonadaceae bacterium]
MQARPYFMALLLSLTPALGIAQTPPARAATVADSLTITFLANEGVMLASGGKKVLIDGLFLKYKTGFATPADSTQRALQQAQPPFDGVDVILATHQHGDHFHPVPVAAHLRANRRATFLTAQQVIDSLRKHAPARELPASRFIARTSADGTRRRDIVNGVVVETLGIPHGGGWRSRGLEHVAYIVELGGKRILHVGDASFSDEALAPFHLDTARIDVALVPAWLVTDEDGRQLVERWIRPRQVVGIHVMEGDEQHADAALRAALPGAFTFTRSLEQRRW